MKSKKLKQKSSGEGHLKKARPKTADFTVTCTGMRYRLTDAELFQLSSAVEDEGGISCKLVPEPDNEVDPKAIKVVGLDLERRVFTNRHLGYVARPTNETVFDALKAGATVKVCLLDFVDEEAKEGELQVSLLMRAR